MKIPSARLNCYKSFVLPLDNNINGLAAHGMRARSYFKFQIKRKTRRDRMRAKLKEIKEEMRQRRHHSIPEQGHWLRLVVTGFFAPTQCQPTFGHPAHSVFGSSTSGAAR